MSSHAIRVRVLSVLKDVPAEGLGTLPNECGAYVIRGSSGRRYVGSSNTVRSRVLAHKVANDPSVREPIGSVCCYLTDGHMDARILEHWLIREIGPEMNGRCPAGAARPGARCRECCEVIRAPGRKVEIHVEIMRRAEDAPACDAVVLPDGPGVYVLKTRSGRYVGFSASLNSRVRAHLKNPRDSNVQESVESLSWYETKTEADAAILEYALIRDLKPELNRENQPDASVWTVHERDKIFAGADPELRALYVELAQRIQEEVGGKEVVRKKWATFQLSPMKNFCAVTVLADRLQVDLKVDERTFTDPSRIAVRLTPTQAWTFNRRLLIRAANEIAGALPLIAQARAFLDR